MVDTLGLLLTVLVHPADIQDRDGAQLLVEQIKCVLPRLRMVFADGAYAGQLIEWLSDADRQLIYEDNARAVYGRLSAQLARQHSTEGATT